MSVRDIDLSIRFKYGNLTIFMFVDPMKPFSKVRQQLLDILKERYPGGITTSVASREKTPLPGDASLIEFAIPKMASDPTQGWKPLKVRDDDTPAGKGLKDNMMVAFAIRSDDEDDDVAFEVEFPTYEEDAAEEEEEE